MQSKEESLSKVKADASF